jgi:hypothetical protein
MDLLDRLSSQGWKVVIFFYDNVIFKISDSVFLRQNLYVFRKMLRSPWSQNVFFWFWVPVSNFYKNWKNKLSYLCVLF